MLELDRLTEAGQVAEPLSSIIKNDVGVFGVDETLALQIANIYGTIGTTNFGYFDRVKKGIIARYDTADNHVNTFIDDLLAAIVAAVCGKIAHQYA
jgi:phosphatidylglycerophosphatase A